MRPVHLLQFLFVAVLASACSVQDAEQAAKARSALIGTSQAALDMCAGLPSKTERIDASTEIRTYEYAPANGNAVNLTLPTLGGVSFGGEGYCHANFRMTQGKVAEVQYAGDTDSGPGGRDAMCEPIIRNCLANGKHGASTTRP